jgi:molybdopterin converting factor small subunit
LARININFIGLWRVLLGVRSITVEVKDIDEARDYVETNYGPILQDKLVSRGITNNWSIWDSSNVLLNGKNTTQADNSILKDGDRLDVVSKVAGG